MERTLKQIWPLQKNHLFNVVINCNVTVYENTVVMTAQLGNLAKFTESYTENVYETLVHKIIPQ